MLADAAGYDRRVSIEDLVGESSAIGAVRDTVKRLASRDSTMRPPVLISGETGTGKGLVARVLHGLSARRAVPIVEINCAAIPPTLLEAELFGYERGAFTDARQAKPGLLESAHLGTLFLDEVGLLSADAQAKLLKVLEDRTVRRLGATRAETVDVWIIAATNENLVAATRERRFREDLYHRLAVMTIALPALRERDGDALLLARIFLDRVCARHGLGRKRFAPEAERAILDHPWPGNVRELANVVERASLLSDEEILTAEALGLVSAATARRRDRPAAISTEGGRRPAPDAAELRAALDATQWNVSRAAEHLGITRNRLRYLMEKQRISPPASPATSTSGRDPDVLPVPEAPTAAETTSIRVAASPVSTLRWEERRLTFFALSATASALDRAAVHRVVESAVEKLQSFGGWVEEISGSGLVAIFGAESIEDAPRRAALAALAISRDASWPESVQVVGAIHTEDLLVGRIGERVALDEGEKREVLAALRALIAMATPGSTVLSERARRVLSRRFEITPIDVRAPGVGAVYVLGSPERADAPTRARRAPFVDRTEELRVLRSLLESAMQGHGQAVLLAGDAGIGKSRLLDEFQRTLAGDRVRYVRSTCLSYGAPIPYLPVQGLLREALGVVETDPPDVARAKIAESLRALGIDDVRGSPAILRLMNVRDATPELSRLSPDALRGRLFETITQLALRFAARTPIVIAVEDLHWIDSASSELLNALVEASAAVRLLFIATARPGYRPPWTGKSYFTQIALHPLPAAESRTIVSSVRGAASISDDVVEAVLAKGEGNPFFLEELALTVVADLRTPSAGITVPETVQDVLLARIERLSDEARRVLETAAVVGREVPRRILRAMVGDIDAIAPALAELVADEFLFQAAGTDDNVYVFRHALTQEVAYRSLTPRARRRLHTRTAEAIESVFVDRLEQVYDRLAYHYSEAAEVERAIHYLVLAGENAARRHAHVEAVTATEEARRRLQSLPPHPDRDQHVVDLVLREAHSLHLLGRMAETLTLLLEHRELIGHLNDPRRSGPYHFWLARTYSVLGDRDLCAASLDRAVASAREAGDDVTLGQSCFLLAFEDFWVGRLRSGVDHAREAVSRLSSTSEQWWLGMSHWAVALNCLVLGDISSAREATEHIARLGSAIGDPRLESCASWMAGWIQASEGDWASAIASCERATRQAKDHVSVLYAAGQLGSAYLDSGDAARAVPHFERAIALAEQLRPGARQTQSRFMALLSEAHVVLDDVDRAEVVAREALRLADLVRHTYATALATRALAGVAQRRGQSADAERYLATALGLFESIEAGPEAARTRARQAALGATPSR